MEGESPALIVEKKEICKEYGIIHNQCSWYSPFLVRVLYCLFHIYNLFYLGFLLIDVLQESFWSFFLSRYITISYIDCKNRFFYRDYFFNFPSRQRNASDRSIRRWCSVRKGVLRNFAKFTRKHLHQLFSCEFYEIFKYSFFTEQLWTTASIQRELDGNAKSIEKMAPADKVHQKYTTNIQ